MVRALAGTLDALVGDGRVERAFGGHEDISQRLPFFVSVSAKRDGLRPMWSGAREAARLIITISSALGPGSIRCRGGVDRRVHSRWRQASPAVCPLLSFVSKANLVLANIVRLAQLYPPVTLICRPTAG